MEVEFRGSPHLHLQLGTALFCCPWAFNHTGVVGSSPVSAQSLQVFMGIATSLAIKFNQWGPWKGLSLSPWLRPYRTESQGRQEEEKVEMGHLGPGRQDLVKA